LTSRLSDLKRLSTLEPVAYKGLAAFAAVAAAVSLTWPLGYDQGAFAWVGRTIAEGGRPYVDAWDNKGPAAHLPFVLTHWMTGGAAWAVHLLDLLILAGATVSLWTGVRSLTNGLVARWTALLFVFWYLGGTFYATAQPDGWAALLLIVALLPCVTQGTARSVRGYVVTGALIGCAALVKHVYAGFLLVPVLHGVFGREVRPAGRLGALAVGSLAPWALVLTWLYAGGALGEYLDLHFGYSASVHATVFELQLGERLQGLIDYVTTAPVVVVLIPAALAGAWKLRGSDRGPGLALLAWFLLGVGIVVLQNKFFIYHWLIPFPPLVVLAAIGLGARPRDTTETASSPGVAPPLVLALAVVALGHAVVHPAWEVARGVSYLAGRVDADTYTDGFGIPGPGRRAARYIRDHSGPDDRVVIWGLGADVLVLADRRPPGRFGFVTPLIVQPESSRAQRYRAEFLESFDRTNPLFVVEDLALGRLWGHDTSRASFPDFDARVRDRYTEVERFGNVSLLRRNDPR
jgi:hypothetical protein